MTIHEEKALRIESATLGAEIVLRKLGIVRDEISQREAYRIFGEANVKSWLNSHLITRVKESSGNSKVTYSLIELETIERLIHNRKIK